jgi:hypothetical protein
VIVNIQDIIVEVRVQLRPLNIHPIQRSSFSSMAEIGIFGSFWLIWLILALFFYGIALFLVGGDFLAMKIIRETPEIKVKFSSPIKLSMKFCSL